MAVTRMQRRPLPLLPDYVPGKRKNGTLADVIQGDEWYQIIFEAHYHCWVVFDRAEIFDTQFEELMPNVPVIVESICDYGEKTGYRFTTKSPVERLKHGKPVLTSAIDGKPPGPIHQIPPLSG